MAIVDGNICCCLCRAWLPLTDYPPSNARAGNGRCHACTRAMHKRPVTKEKIREYNLRNTYGITPTEYDARLIAQGGGCACCGAKTNPSGKRLFVDHDHVTGAVRGLLCYHCNTGIGALGDNAAGVKRALAYLDKSTPPVVTVDLQIPDSYFPFEVFL